MKGILRLKEDKTWVVEYNVWDDERTYELPVCPETMLLIKCKPELEVEFKESANDNKVCAKLIPTQSKDEKIIKSRVKELMSNNFKIKTRLGNDCEICGEHIGEWSKPVCDECFDTLKELVIQRRTLKK